VVRKFFLAFVFSVGVSPWVFSMEPSRVTPQELCTLSLKVLVHQMNSTAYPESVSTQPLEYVPIDMESFIGRPLPFGFGWINTIAPLLPPALHANILYRRMLAEHTNPRYRGKSLFQTAREVMGYQLSVSNTDLQKIPQTGSFLMISNHPTGVLDGVVDSELLARRGREDFAIVVAHFLEKSMSAHPDLQRHFIYVDRRHRKFAETPEQDLSVEQKRILQEANTLNRREFRKMLQMRKDGQVVVLYPSGSIASQLPNGAHPVTYDGQWDSTTVTMAQSMGVIVPTFKVTRNSDRYLELKRRSINASRRAYFEEALNKQGKTVQVIVGEPFTWKEVEEAIPSQPGISKEELLQRRLEYIRSRVDQLDPTGLAPHFARPSPR
jgi:putative hemolysin